MGAQASLSKAITSRDVGRFCLSVCQRSQLPQVPEEVKASEASAAPTRAACDVQCTELTSSSAALADRLDAVRTKTALLAVEKSELRAVRAAVMATIAEFAPVFETEEATDDEGELDEGDALEPMFTTSAEDPVPQVDNEEAEYKRLLEEQQLLQEECHRLRAALGAAADTVTQIAEQSYQLAETLEDAGERTRSRSHMMVTQPTHFDSVYLRDLSDTGSEHGATSTVEASDGVCDPSKLANLKPLCMGQFGGSQATSSTATPATSAPASRQPSPRSLLALAA